MDEKDDFNCYDNKDEYYMPYKLDSELPEVNVYCLIIDDINLMDDSQIVDEDKNDDTFSIIVRFRACQYESSWSFSDHHEPQITDKNPAKKM